jgi:hypothetical protein
MTPQRWARIKEVFGAAFQRPEAEGPFISTGRVATFQNSAMFWEQKKTASFPRKGFETAWAAGGQRRWFGCALRRRMFVSTRTRINGRGLRTWLRG